MNNLRIEEIEHRFTLNAADKKRIYFSEEIEH
jgi:hypothetical protein